MRMDKQKAANTLDKLIQCLYLQSIGQCPNVTCNECDYSTDMYSTDEIIEAMKTALEALEDDADD